MPVEMIFSDPLEHYEFQMPEIEALIGRVLLKFAWAESEVWRLLPERSRGTSPRFAKDVNNLESLIEGWENTHAHMLGDDIPLTMWDLGMYDIDQIKQGFDAVRTDRNTLAHGNLQMTLSQQLDQTACGEVSFPSALRTEGPAFMVSDRPPFHGVELSAARLQGIADRVEEILKFILYLSTLKEEM